jgi:hypothetical protein
MQQSSRTQQTMLHRSSRQSYTKNLTEEEIIERKDEYSEIAISLSEIAVQKKK